MKRRKVDSEVEELEDTEELESSHQEVKAWDQRVRGFEPKRARLRASSLESTREMATSAYNTDVVSIYKDRVAPGKDDPEAEVTPRSQE